MVETLARFFAMGGYGGFIWPAFGVTVLVMAALLIQSLCSLHERQSTLSALQAEVAFGHSGNSDET
jgi:heme exporter protein D